MADHQDNAELLRRWRLILGRYAQPLQGEAWSAQDGRLDASLDYLYGREYERKGMLRGGSAGAGGSLDPSQLRAIDWLNQARKLFPQEVYERVQGHAIERYELSGLLRDPSVLASLEPNQALARALIGMRGRLSANMTDAVRAIIRRVVEEITERLRKDFVNAVTGRRNRFRRSQINSAQNFDWRATIAANLKHYDTASARMVIARPIFNARVRRSLPWDVILCVDQSASMMDSVIYAAVVAGILSGLPAVNVRLVVFDTSVVDLTHLASDPVEVLLTVQLGGGTNIGRAVQYCEQLVVNPQRTVMALISDFEEGAPPGPLLASLKRMAESRVTLLGLAALDERAQPVYDRGMAQRLADQGMHVAALTPQHFAEWLAEVMQ
ncbi:VWA domain-containing protein [Janthinobacterium psychrotolerans]|uniref:VWA domain containing CoxE-like protein n=1 Tax=Janthinobacterium psychrotolerans TaxID=1747903 RepID=A0A1A7C0Z9_9BURK|nr:VWA domain-containing protein [Janthinobacterium psychrotolerans]OBV39621.1 VWA domain containing CoxE-like protein [Janthinobacterium psychrotolerans]